MAIKGLRIDNFKCFEKAEIELNSLCVLTGENSAGKTTIIQAILFQLQSIGNSGQDTLNGRFISLGNINDVKNCYTRGDIHVDVSFSMEPDKQRDRTVYLTTDRIGPRSEFPQNVDLDFRIGTHGEYAFSYLSRNRMERIPELSFVFDDESGLNFGNQVDYWLHYLCGYTVIAEEIEGTQIVKVSFQTDDHVKNYRSLDVGTGVTYLAVIIIAALSCTKEDVLIVENPELYLHPAAQSKFMELFSFLARQGLQVIMETHSDHIINGLRKEVKRNHISKDEVKILFVKKEEYKSYINEILLNDSGVLLNPMKGFFDQIDDDLDVLLGFMDE